MSTITSVPTFDLAQKWKQLCQLQKQDTSDSNDFVVEQWWKTIVQRHSEEHRAYHTLNHLKELFQWFERFEHLLPQDADRRLVVQWSIFFHDIIYDSKASDNEEQSAKLFEQFASQVQWIPQQVVDSVVKYILCTKNHNSHAQETDEALKWFLDFDLGILGSNEERYNEYSRQIRHEYQFVPFDTFCEKRAAFLQHMASTQNNNNQKLYYTQEMTQLCESQAFANMNRECASLQKKQLLP